MASILVTGYRHTDLGIFSNKDPRLVVIKKAIRNDLEKLIEEGADWFIFTGNLGFEYWCLEILKELQGEGYHCKLATIFPFENHGENWNEDNQIKLSHFKSVDFVKYAYPRYEAPNQFREYNQFLLDNTDGTYIFYDNENETNLKYLYHLILKKDNYTRKELTFDYLNEVAENFEENK
ncbi:TPA: DUF1273 domain-containing protein [Streptococcus suis]|nr:DUF1273 domain-containing protein [Streptococcus suis]MCQ8266025.1 DUF1273 domain-containing protein [Streptococcus suis]HEL1584723.1 DUF1273 domain-containing protein [Streptococcus suis]HEL9645184.1 DUF1273 domain-containing protein [Streptococcus suis]